MKKLWQRVLGQVCVAVSFLLAILSAPAGVSAASLPLLLKDINTGTSNSTPNYLTNFNGTLMFRANDLSNGTELWSSDGSEAGTVLLKDIIVGTGSSSPLYLTINDTTLYFTATDTTNGQELWKSNGTGEGTVLVKDINTGSANSTPSYLTNVNGTLFFAATTATNGQELWKSNGSDAGTVLVKDINAGTGSASLLSLTNVNNTLFFVAYDPTNGQELWKSDGTLGGTVMVKDINTSTGNSSPSYLTNVNGTLFFVANNGTNGIELWKSDGTLGGTMLVKDIWSGTGNSSPSALTNVNGTLFFAANNGTNGVELWKSDGTATGTVMVKDIYADTGSSSPVYLTNVNGTLFFAANDGTTGAELWKSDGTTVGTVLVKDINEGTSGSSPLNLTGLNGTLFFAANNGVIGQELWKSNGTEVGTVLVSDIYPGLTGSSPSSLTAYGSNLVFRVTDSLVGVEPFILDLTEPDSTVTYPLNNANLSGGALVAVSGTATDDMVGVGSVEVSTDGGSSWAAATDTSAGGDWSTWSYDWLTPTSGGTQQLKSRAIDLATNLETPATGPSVNLSVLYTLSATIVGNGTVTGDATPVLSCSAGTCGQGYSNGTVVNLTATPDSGYTFTSWSGACTGSGACQVTMNAAKNVTATFTGTNVYHTLTVAKAGTGTGTVTSSPTGIDCGSDCSEAFTENTVVTLTATAGGDSGFDGWAGACTGTGTCQVTMDAAKTATATFKLLAATPASISGVPTSSNTGTFSINWGASATAGVTYVLEQAVDGGAYTELYRGTNQSWSVTSLANGSYVFRVKAIRDGYVDSTWQTSVTCVVTLKAGMPSRISGVPTSSTSGTFTVIWEASTTTGTTYVLERAYKLNPQDPLGPFNEVYRGTKTSFSVTSLVNGSYVFRVKAVKTGLADSDYNTSVTCVVTWTAGMPSTIIYSSGTTGTFKVSWSRSSTSGATYVLERADNGGGFSQVYSGTKTSYSVTALPSGSYVFRIKATKPNYADSAWKTGGTRVVQ